MSACSARLTGAGGRGAGFIATAFGETADDAWRRHVEQITPLGRWGTPGDVAAAAVFLASPEAEFLTGVALPVNGGVV